MTARSTSAAPPRRAPAAVVQRARRRRRAVRRRRVLGAMVLVALLAGTGAVVSGAFDHAVREISLPLRHEDIIRQQAADKGLDPALIAAVIYTESRFAPRTSSAGAEGLMQITPDTAQFIARTSGGTAFTVSDLATPQVNISYGSWYLRYLLRRYGGDETLALAAYNAGLGNVDRWIARARAQGRELAVSDIPFPETRAYVENVLALRKDYAASYARELGL